jgi:CrcB protein
MKSVLLVACGGAVGSVARYLVGVWATRAGSLIPLATIGVNLTGCFFVGLVAGLAVARPGTVTPDWRLFLVVGVCGGFTTFSAFSLETLELVRLGHPLTALTTALVQVLVGIAAVWAGVAISKLI